MNRTASFFLTATIFFLAGLLSYAGSQWYFRAYLSGTITVQGVLKFQAQMVDPSASGNPPNGYFVESTAIGRVYVEGNLIKPFVGFSVLPQGKMLSTVWTRYVSLLSPMACNVVPLCTAFVDGTIRTFKLWSRKIAAPGRIRNGMNRSYSVQGLSGTVAAQLPCESRRN